MPNNCDNDLWIRGRADIVTVVLARHVKDGALDAESLIPYPAKFRERDEAVRTWYDHYDAAHRSRFGAAEATEEQRKAFRQDFIAVHGACPSDAFDSGYEWRLKHWGSKWGTYDGDPVRELRRRAAHSRAVRLRFFSAWSPPEPLIRSLAAQYPTLTIRHRYYEFGCGFKGQADYTNGISVNSWISGEYRGRRGG